MLTYSDLVVCAHGSEMLERLPLHSKRGAWALDSKSCKHDVTGTIAGTFGCIGKFVWRGLGK
jgi:hypothetical protein